MVISVQYRETQTTMKKISLLFFFALLIIFNKSVLGNEDLVIDAPSPLPSEQYITEEHLLDEIESLQDRLDSLVANGRLSASAAMTASGVLATLAFGVFRIAFYARAVEDKWMYEWDTGDWEGVILYSLMDSVLPALGIGGLMGFSNFIDEELPSLSAKDSIKVSFQTFVTGLGLSLIVAAIKIEDKSDGLFSQTRILLHALTHGLTAYRTYTYILQERQAKQNKIFDLQYQLTAARKRLSQLREESNQAETP